MLQRQQFYLFGQNQTSQTGGQPKYSDTSPYGECSLACGLAVDEAHCFEIYMK